MSTLQHDEAMIQALAITKAQAGVRSMSAEEIVTYINDLVRAIRSTLDKNTEDDGQAEEKVDTEGLDPRKSIRERERLLFPRRRGAAVQSEIPAFILSSGGGSLPAVRTKIYRT